ncbi:hypothetical protein [Chryseobacterium lactis]|uniref:hypothetical protein n=1 Tax=Chryseobacterium lactis TaxID=1241981 RepID=UPI0016247704|nr:hypothetical protein [Chryseobacterium lactis]
MEIQLNKILLISILFLFSCKGDAQKNKKTFQQHEQKTQQEINFFDKKYHASFSMLVDESTIADHPIQTFLDCKDSYFTIHYIPKSQSLKNFWKKEYFEKNNIEMMNQDKESGNIEAIVKKNINDYDVFCYYVSSKFLKTHSHCSTESVFLDDKTQAQIYNYSAKENKWKLIKEIQSSQIPPILDSKYFTDHLPYYFTSTISKNDTKLSNTLKDWEGLYLNSDDKNLKTYQSIIDKVGWFKLKITTYEILFSADTRMRDDYPQSDPGGVYINNRCNYYISNDNDTIEIYKKEYNAPNSTPVNIRGDKKNLLITLYKKDKAFYGTSNVIEDSEQYDNSARIKGNAPYQFYKFSLEEDKDKR